MIVEKERDLISWRPKAGEAAKELYYELIEAFKNEVPNLQTGEFGADMKVEIINDGPVTLLLESKKEF